MPRGKPGRKSSTGTVHSSERKGAVSSRDRRYSSSTGTAGFTYPTTTTSCSSPSEHSAPLSVKGTCCGSHTWKAQQPRHAEPGETQAAHWHNTCRALSTKAAFFILFEEDSSCHIIFVCVSLSAFSGVKNILIQQNLGIVLWTECGRKVSKNSRRKPR